MKTKFNLFIVFIPFLFFSFVSCEDKDELDVDNGNEDFIPVDKCVLKFILDDTDNTATVCGFIDVKTNLEIPEKVSCDGKTYIVSRIKEKSFEDCLELKDIKIPTTITHIGNSAFKNCTGLSSIEIPNTVSCIEDNVFEDCTGLSNVEIPKICLKKKTSR